MRPENEVRIGREIATLREELMAVSRRRNKVDAIQDKAAGLKAEAAQLQEELQLAQLVLERQEQEKSRIVGALTALQEQLAG
jgi:acyl carrier protein phosphodiesterase